MAYARFVLPSTPAKLANPAKVEPSEPRTLAGIATLAGVHAENHFSEPLHLATVAEATPQPSDAIRCADLRNSLTLYEPQADPNRCHFCGERETPAAPFIAVLTAKPGAHHWLHADCHPEHVRRLDARVEAALADDEPAPF